MKSLNKILALTLILTGSSLLPALPTLGQPLGSTIEFTPPPLADRGRTSDGRRRGAATRGDCEIPEDQPGLVSLTPSVHVETGNRETGNREQLLDQNLDPTRSIFDRYESVFSLTTDPLPSFWFYVPYSQADTVLFEFVFQDADGNTLHQHQFEADRPGIIQVSLPATVDPLILDESYQWYFLAHCTSDPATVAPYVSGWIARTQLSPEIQGQLEVVSSLEQARIYAANGIWQNSLTLLGELYRTTPESSELRSHWRSLLSSVELDALSDQPFAD